MKIVTYIFDMGDELMSGAATNKPFSKKAKTWHVREPNSVQVLVWVTNKGIWYIAGVLHSNEKFPVQIKKLKWNYFELSENFTQIRSIGTRHF